jgi:multiple sugar transport system substrate-binding protein
MAVAILAVIGAAFTGFARAETTITVWSHEADSPRKVAWRELAARNFEKKNPGVTVKITWFQKEPLYSALKTALRSGQGPDAFYDEPDQTEYIDNNLVVPLDDLVNWENIQPWARAVWTRNGKTYAVPQEVYTIELFYNKELMKKLGVTIPPNGQFSQAQFLDAVKKAVAAGITPLAVGVGDRPYPGAFVLGELLLKKLGRDDYGKLIDGKLSYKDPRVVEIFKYVRELVEAKAYPASFATLKLGESWMYFWAKPGALMMPMATFIMSRLGLGIDKGGIPEDFPLGVMQLPAVANGACNHCKTAAVSASFSINAASKNQKLAAGYLNEMATPEMGVRWLETIHLQTAVKTGNIKVTGKYAPIFEELLARNTGMEYFIGTPVDLLKGQCLDTFTQVMNTAFPAGLLSVDQATEMMNQACFKR